MEGTVNVAEPARSQEKFYPENATHLSVASACGRQLGEVR